MANSPTTLQTTVPLPSQPAYPLPSSSSIRPPNFNEARRGSLGATDPFLPIQVQVATSTTPTDVPRRSSMDINLVLNADKSDARPPSSAGPSAFPGPSAGYAFGSTFSAGPTGAPDETNSSSSSRPYVAPTSALPTHMGGFRPTGATAGAENSFFDYSMRRHSLTNAGQSPERLPSLSSNGVPSPSSSNKRKASVDGGIEAGYTYPANNGGNYAAPFPPYAKRRASDQRRESVSSGWEEERRGVPATWQAGGLPGGGIPGGGTAGQGFSAPYSSSGPGEFEPYYRPPYGENNSGGEVYSRRPSVPSITSIGGPPSSSMYSPSSHNDSTTYSGSTRGGPPSVIVSNRSRSPGPPASSASYSNLPPAQAAWARAGPLPPNAHGGPRSAPGGGGSGLDPSSAYGPGGSKETPYSRSPELRVSHKLAERKRRKEMAQLFDELRDSLPNDRGLKSSKWEILSKAVDFIANLKEHNGELIRDNNMLRNHFGLGPGPQAQSTEDSPPGQQQLPQQQPQQQQQQQQQHHQNPQGNYNPQLDPHHQSPRIITPNGGLPLLPSPSINDHHQGGGGGGGGEAMAWASSNGNSSSNNNNNKSVMTKVLAAAVAANDDDRRRSPRSKNAVTGSIGGGRRGTRSGRHNEDEEEEEEEVDDLDEE